MHGHLFDRRIERDIVPRLRVIKGHFSHFTGLESLHHSKNYPHSCRVILLAWTVSDGFIEIAKCHWIMFRNPFKPLHTCLLSVFNKRFSFRPRARKWE